SSPNVSLLDELGQSVDDRGFNLTSVLAELGRNIVHVQSPVDVSLILAGNWSLPACQPVFIKLEAIALRPASEGDIVFLAAREVIQSEWKLTVIDDAQVRVDDKPASIDDSSINDHAGFRFALANHLADSGKADETTHDLGRIFRTGEDVDVSNNLLPPA